MLLTHPPENLEGSLCQKIVCHKHQRVCAKKGVFLGLIKTALLSNNEHRLSSTGRFFLQVHLIFVDSFKLREAFLTAKCCLGIFQSKTFVFSRLKQLHFNKFPLILLHLLSCAVSCLRKLETIKSSNQT